MKKTLIRCLLSMMLSVERHTHLPPELYRIIGKYICFKQDWEVFGDRPVSNYNKVLNELPRPCSCDHIHIVYSSALAPFRYLKFFYSLRPCFKMPDAVAPQVIVECTEYRDQSSEELEVEYRTGLDLARKNN